MDTCRKLTDSKNAILFDLDEK